MRRHDSPSVRRTSRVGQCLIAVVLGGCFAEADQIPPGAGTGDPTSAGSSGSEPAPSTGVDAPSTSSAMSSESTESAADTTASSTAGADADSTSTGEPALGCTVWDFEDGVQPFVETLGEGGTLAVVDGDLVVSFEPGDASVAWTLEVDAGVDISTASLEARGLSSPIGTGRFIGIRAVDVKGRVVSLNAEGTMLLAGYYDGEATEPLMAGTLPAEFDGVRLEFNGPAVTLVVVLEDGSLEPMPSLLLRQWRSDNAVLYLNFGVFAAPAEAGQLAVGRVESCVDVGG